MGIEHHHLKVIRGSGCILTQIGLAQQELFYRYHMFHLLLGTSLPRSSFIISMYHMINPLLMEIRSFRGMDLSQRFLNFFTCSRIIRRQGVSGVRVLGEIQESR